MNDVIVTAADTMVYRYCWNNTMYYKINILTVVSASVSSWDHLIKGSASLLSAPTWNTPV